MRSTLVGALLLGLALLHSKLLDLPIVLFQLLTCQPCVTLTAPSPAAPHPPPPSKCPPQAPAHIIHPAPFGASILLLASSTAPAFSAFVASHHCAYLGRKAIQQPPAPTWRTAPSPAVAPPCPFGPWPPASSPPCPPGTPRRPRPAPSSHCKGKPTGRPAERRTHFILSAPGLFQTQDRLRHTKRQAEKQDLKGPKGWGATQHRHQKVDLNNALFRVGAFISKQVSFGGRREHRLLPRHPRHQRSCKMSTAEAPCALLPDSSLSFAMTCTGPTYRASTFSYHRATLTQ